MWLSGLAQAGGAEQQHVVQRLAAFLGRVNEDLQLLARLHLPDVLVQHLGAQGALHGVFMWGCHGGAHHPLRLGPALLRLALGAGRQGHQVVGLYAHTVIITALGLLSARNK